MTTRGKWTGVTTIVRLNWPFYAAAAVVLAITAALMGAGVSGVAWWLALAAMAGAAWFIVGSLVASHLAYDRSDLYRFGWLQRALRKRRTDRLIYCHCGFDDASPLVRSALGRGEWLLLDHYDPARMTEPSIRRARALYPPTRDARAARFDAWPVEDESVDLVFALLAIHELRRDEERAGWFREARRSVRAGGAIIVLEHLRDLANFAAFGPGFLHFHSRAAWQRAWQSAGLECVDEFRVSPWVVAFVLEPTARAEPTTTRARETLHSAPACPPGK